MWLIVILSVNLYMDIAGIPKHILYDISQTCIVYANDFYIHRTVDFHWRAIKSTATICRSDRLLRQDCCSVLGKGKCAQYIIYIIIPYYNIYCWSLQHAVFRSYVHNTTTTRLRGCRVIILLYTWWYCLHDNHDLST